jgi:class 3 adenylate cyclase/DNA-binding CsgD family transcriptional regulator
MDDIRAVMDAVGSRRAAVMGISEGGSMSILFAATYPERTSALVLIGTAPRWEWAPDWPWARNQREFEKASQAIEEGWGTLEWAARDLQRRAPGHANDPEFVRWFATYTRMGASPGAAVALNRLNRMIDNRQVLSAIRVPTLIVHRSGELIARVEAARYMAAHIPGASYVELPGDEHLPFLGDQNEILEPIEKFLGAGGRTAEPESMLATVLAMEIANAPQVMANLREARWREVQHAYAEVVQRALDFYRGRSVMSGSDGLLVTFDGPSRAIRCAQTIVEQTLALGVEPRAGLHTGECEIADGKPGGLPVRLAAWVMAQAKPGEILASNTVRDLVSGSAIVFEDTDVHVAAPGVGRRMRLFRIESSYRAGGTGGSPAAPVPIRDQLTPREREVVGLLARGRTNREIADALVISERTVENHVSNVLGKLRLDTRGQVALWALGRYEAGAPISA